MEEDKRAGQPDRELGPDRKGEALPRDVEHVRPYLEARAQEALAAAKAASTERELEWVDVRAISTYETFEQLVNGLAAFGRSGDPDKDAWFSSFLFAYRLLAQDIHMLAFALGDPTQEPSEDELAEAARHKASPRDVTYWYRNLRQSLPSVATGLAFATRRFARRADRR